MPELPEVETSRRGILPHCKHKTVTKIIIRQPQLRWRVPEAIQHLQGQRIEAITRRGKYILFISKVGTAILHLGMSGSLRIFPCDTPAGKHDHVDIIFDDTHCLRLKDPRRFGSLLWTTEDPMQHKLLKRLGPEPLTPDFNAEYLFAKSRNSKRAVKLFIMDSHVVVGVGNIYATESLFNAGIDPRKPAQEISLNDYARLVQAIKTILRYAIKRGGTTLRDFTNATDGKPGYFQQELNVYGRDGELCKHCGETLTLIKLGGRATVFCKICQQ